MRYFMSLWVTAASSTVIFCFTNGELIIIDDAQTRCACSDLNVIDEDDGS